MASPDCGEYGEALAAKGLGYRYADLARWLKRAGYAAPRSGAGSHRVWRHPAEKDRVTLVDCGNREVLPAYVKKTARRLWALGGCE